MTDNLSKTLNPNLNDDYWWTYSARGDHKPCMCPLLDSYTIHNLIDQHNILTDFVRPLISMIHDPMWYLSHTKWYYDTSSDAACADQVDLDNMYYIWYIKTTSNIYLLYKIWSERRKH